VSPQPERDTTAGRVYNDLRNVARRQGRPTDELFQLYLLERFLYRLANSPLRDHLVLKGGMLLAAYQLRRATQDIDAQARGIDNDADEVAGLVREVCAIDADDGLTFHLEELTVEAIREGAAYEGLRVRVPVSLGQARLTLRLDVNFGDPITLPRPRSPARSCSEATSTSSATPSQACWRRSSSRCWNCVMRTAATGTSAMSCASPGSTVSAAASSARRAAPPLTIEASTCNRCGHGSPTWQSAGRQRGRGGSPARD
jgi:hypothetical protein